MTEVQQNDVRPRSHIFFNHVGATLLTLFIAHFIVPIVLINAFSFWQAIIHGEEWKIVSGNNFFVVLVFLTVPAAFLYIPFSFLIAGSVMRWHLSIFVQRLMSILFVSILAGLLNYICTHSRCYI